MDLLLDTHVVLWWLADDGRLSSEARVLIADTDNRVHVSAASAWEVVIKQGLGKLRLEGDFEAEVRDNGFNALPVLLRHAAEIKDLPPIHRDPFDRMLVAQSRVENLHLMTADPRLFEYPTQTIPV